MRLIICFFISIIFNAFLCYGQNQEINLSEFQKINTEQFLNNNIWVRNSMFLIASKIDSNNTILTSYKYDAKNDSLILFEETQVLIKQIAKSINKSEEEIKEYYKNIIVQYCSFKILGIRGIYNPPYKAVRFYLPEKKILIFIPNESLSFFPITKWKKLADNWFIYKDRSDLGLGG